ncbi:hypothetical protein [Paenibacillus polymyxa]|uniref:hypothetical protein n=1 Tax=Paenibacillus polymyxa TaxID=1406 RepID=UPI0020C7D815|nr:hypothetical protein [Paenibacillus polymyxa]
MSIQYLVKKAHENAVNKGWYEEPRSFGDVIALTHAELSEALEDYRNGYGLKEIYYEGQKPCGIPIELADYGYSTSAAMSELTWKQLLLKRWLTTSPGHTSTAAR